MAVLLVIDMQVGVFAQPRYDADNVVDRVNELIARAREAEAPIIFVRHNEKQGEPLEYGSKGWEILPLLDVLDTDVKVEKHCCDAFCETDLEKILTELGADTIVMAGCCTDFCVDTTVRQAAGRGYKVMVAADAHTTADRPHSEARALIRHHNWVWENLAVPRDPIRVIYSDAIYF